MWNWVTIGRDVLGWQMSLVNALYRKQKINWKARVDSLIQILNRLLDKLEYAPVDEAIAPVEPTDDIVDTDVEQEETLNYDEM